ncbi:Maf family protein [Gracilinema caldarium]|uniref:dTTP/UTP pyrophosphatase n=1 Tax=Gracilinema caldarium (strain ATCC 51460 / DSM 7334 / H1) TaxID=744872 RepID=F8F3I3_GRAC1|nr:Maf family protein [Gracilinema caldarium]AEJ19559.1 Septum formation protein Maf [Gracilinema caldarium DSM 7334]
MEPIILASGSLRRQEYFKLLGLPFNIMPSYVDETAPAELSPREHAEHIANRKVKKILEVLEGRLPLWILGADTIISIDNTIFGKPADRQEAYHMLKTFSGRTHEVITAMALYVGREKRIATKAVSSTVRFSHLRDDEIEWYLDTGEWQGVAGGYQIQALAACFISHIEGSYSGIVGLPIHEFYGMLRENGYPYGA